MMMLSDSTPLFAGRRRHLERGAAHGGGSGGSGNGGRGLHGKRSGEGAPTSAPSEERESRCRRRKKEVKCKEEEIPNPKIEDVSRRD